MRSSHESGPEGGSSRSLLHQAAFPSLALKQPRSERQSRMALCTARMAGAVFAPGGGGSGFSHPGNPQCGCQAGVAGRVHDGGKGRGRGMGTVETPKLPAKPTGSGQSWCPWRRWKITEELISQ